MGSDSAQGISALVQPDRVHRRCYTDPELFDLEMQRIFGAAWIYVGHDSQVPNAGDYVTALVGKQQVAMIRHTDGNIHVLYNRCPHKGAKVLPEGAGHAGKTVRCGYHAWTFRCDGSLLSVPWRAGYEGTRFDFSDPAFSMRRVAQVDSVRGFVFANLSDSGPGLREFLGGALTSLENFVDRAPEGEVEVAGGVFRVLQRSNWKIFLENLNDTMHPMVVHESSVRAARAQHEEKLQGVPKPFEIHIVDGNGEPYEFWEKLDLRGYDNGHSYMGAIFTAPRDPVSLAHVDALENAYGKARTREILEINRHNTIIYPSCSPHTSFQQLRVIRPLAVDRTLVEIYTFRLKGAPDGVFERALSYANVVNSPSSNVMPDDLEAYNRVQEGLLADAGEWVSLHRNAGQEQRVEGGVAANGTSEMPMRNQFRAWVQYMRTGA
jgi:phenylpropionate dioxygenase-like ring-hydroxylating dioxygenase large terminal subunit